MCKLRNSVVKTLEAQPFYYNGNKLEIQEEAKEWYFSVDRYDVAKSPENIKKFFKALRMEGYKGNLPRFSQIVDNQKTEYNKTGWKYTEEFLDTQRIEGGTLHSVVLTMGIHQLYSKDTVKKAVPAVKKLVGKYPAYWKIERNDSLDSKIHVHILILAPETHKFPKRVNNYPVYTEVLGSREKYASNSTFQNVRGFMMYLFKPSDGRASFNVPEHVEQMYLDWWEEGNRLDAGEKPQWERVTLRGPLNLNIKWLKNFDRHEIEARYEEAPAHQPLTPAPISKSKDCVTVLNTVPHVKNSEIVKQSVDVSAPQQQLFIPNPIFTVYNGANRHQQAPLRGVR